MRLERIGNIAQFINGAPFKPEDWCENGMKIIRIQNLTDPNKPYNKTNRIVDKKYIVTKGDVLVSWSATIDVFTWEDEDALLNQHIFKVIFDKSKVEKSYFIIALKETINELTKFAHGATMKHVVKGDFDNHKIPLPPIPVQLHIANILSKAENLITQRKQSIALLDDFLKSTFLEMFGDPVRNEMGWEKSELKNYAKVRIGPFGSLLHREDYVQNGVPLVNPSHIGEGKIFIDSDLTISKEKMRELSAYVMHEGDVVLGRRGEIGRCAVVTENEEGFLCGTGSIFIRPIKALNPIFLYNIISSASMRKVLENLAKGITMKNLNSGIVEDLKLPVPPLALQTQFAQIVERTEAIKAHYQSSLQELDNLYSSLSQRAFRGELILNQPEEQVLMAAEPETEYQKQ